MLSLAQRVRLARELDTPLADATAADSRREPNGHRQPVAEHVELRFANEGARRDGSALHHCERRQPGRPAARGHRAVEWPGGGKRYRRAGRENAPDAVGRPRRPAPNRHPVIPASGADGRDRRARPVRVRRAAGRELPCECLARVRIRAARLARRDGRLQDAESATATIRLEPAFGIAGRVRTRSGRPVAGALVRALRYQTSGGFPRLVETARVTTNDRGDYRLADVPFGDCYVNASGAGVGGPPSGDPKTSFAPTFHPASTTMKGARAVAATTSRRGITKVDVTVQPAAMGRIVVSAVDSAGNALPRGRDALSSAGVGRTCLPRGQDDRAGRRCRLRLRRRPSG